MRTRHVAPTLLVALVLIAPTALGTLANASPPDPSWIPGIYDDADFDNVVVLVTSATANVGPAGPADFEPAPLLDTLTPPAERADVAVPVSAVRPRAPPR